MMRDLDRRTEHYEKRNQEAIRNDGKRKDVKRRVV